MGAISGYTAATAITDDDVLLGNDGSTTKKFPGTLFRMPATYIVASSEAPTVIKNRADYVCDGTADEVQLNAALLLGNVQMTDGRYYLSNTVTLSKAGGGLFGTGLFSNRTSDGITWGSGSQLILASGFAGTAAVRCHSGSSTIATSGHTLRDFSIDGASRGSGVIGVHWRSYQGHCDNVLVAVMTGDAFYVEPLSGWDIYDAKFSNLHGAFNGGAGFSTTAADGQLTNSVFNNNTTDGLWVGGSSWQISNVHVYSNTQVGIRLYGGSASRTKITNCKIEHSGQHGINFQSVSGSNAADVQIIGCGFNCNGESAHNTYMHLALGGPGSAWKPNIIGNEFGNSDSASNLPAYAVYIADESRYVVFSLNNFGNDNGGSVASYFGAGATMLSTSRFVGNVGLSDRGTG